MSQVAARESEPQLFTIHRPSASLRGPAALATALYAAFAFFWIYGSDLFVESFFKNPETIVQIESAKGTLFVLITSLALFLVIQFYTSKLRHDSTLSQETTNTEYDLLDALPDSAFVVGREGNFKFLNRAALKILGETADHLTGTNLFAIVSEESHPLINSAIHGALKGQDTDIKCFIECAGGKRPFRIRAHAVRDTSGQIEHIIGVAHDLTHRAERLHYKAEAHTRFSGIPHAMHQAAGAIGNVLEARDSYTSRHQNRVTDLAMGIAQELHVSEFTKEGVQLAAALHDLGKIAIPNEILTKPDKLTGPERQLVNRHPGVAYEILRKVDFPWPVADVAHQHHERIDGSGYPNGLRGNQICLEARIIGVADVLDALTSHRPYRGALPLEVGIEELQKNAGILYDPEVVNACLRYLERKPHSSMRS